MQELPALVEGHTNVLGNDQIEPIPFWLEG